MICSLDGLNILPVRCEIEISEYTFSSAVHTRKHHRTEWCLTCNVAVTQFHPVLLRFAAPFELAFILSNSRTTFQGRVSQPPLLMVTTRP